LIPRERVRTSYLARIPFAGKYFRALAPLYPGAFEAFDLSGFDTIVSSTTSWAKGVIVPPGSVHVCYTNTVSRFAFAYDDYVGGFGRSSGNRLLPWLARPVVRRLVAWDKRAAQRPTAYVANSRNVADRIERFYGRQADVLHCPVELDRFTIGNGGGDYFLIASRLLPYKHIDLAIRAAQMAGVRLMIAGTGPAEGQLRALARGTTTTMLGYVDDAVLNALMGDARAAVLPAEEDFGLLPLEAAAAGRPTIALRRGGALETIVEGRTGAFFDEPAAESLAAALQAFDGSRFDRQALRAHAETFAPATFSHRLRAIVERVRADAESRS
jgi:glycosyltransferase involved in cell wall biosynthesis